MDSSIDILAAIRKQQRLCLLIDNSNLFHALKSIQLNGGPSRMDYIRLRDALADGREVDVRFYYSEPQKDNDTEDLEKQANRNRFYNFLEDKLNFIMVRLPLRTRSGYDLAASSIVRHLRELNYTDNQILQIARQRPNWLKQIEGAAIPEEKGLDCEIVHDMVRLSLTTRYDSFVLVAGDEDYARTVRRMRHDGFTVDVAFFGGNRCSQILQREASHFIDLATIPSLFKDGVEDYRTGNM